MRAFRDSYQPQVLANAKAFARALADAGLDVQGDPAIDFTETHQVVVKVGYGRGHEMAARLEASNVLCNYQGLPDEEAFTAAGGLRLGVAEMTRFGMREDDFGELAVLMADVIVRDAAVADPGERPAGALRRAAVLLWRRRAGRRARQAGRVPAMRRPSGPRGSSGGARPVEPMEGVL